MKPFTTEVPPLAERKITYVPGIVVYELVLKNSNGKTAIASVTYDRASGTLTVLEMEKGV